MATTLYLTENSASYKNVAQYYVARISAGSGPVASAIIGGAGITVDSQWTRTSGGEFVQWLTAPITKVFYETWTTGNSMNTARSGMGAAGSQSATAAFGGYDSLGVNSLITEHFNGTSWSAGGNLTTARRYLAGCGILAAALAIGGSVNSFSTEIYNGTVWSWGPFLNTPRQQLAATGTTTEALAFGGFTTVNVATTEEYNGISWSAGGDLTTARRLLAGCGTQNAGLSFGGVVVSVSAVTEEYNGTTWASGGSLNTARQSLGGTGGQYEALSTGGFVAAASAVTEEYNGATWGTSKNLNTSRTEQNATGTTSAGLSVGGSNTATTELYAPVQDNWFRAGGVNANTETTNHWISENNAALNAGIRWTLYRWRYEPTTNAITETPFLTFNNSTEPGTTPARSTFTTNFVHNWATRSPLLTARGHLAGAGTVNAAVSFGGTTSYNIATSDFANTEEYNGTSWYASGSLLDARSGLAGCGTQTAALSIGGTTGTLNSAQLSGNLVYSYNGDTWSSATSLTNARYGHAACGTQTAAVAWCGANGTSALSSTEKYNGTSWSSSGVYAAGVRSFISGAGTQTAAISVGGMSVVNLNQGATVYTESYTYNGTSWSAASSPPGPSGGGGMTGTQNQAVLFSFSGNWNGSSWATLPTNSYEYNGTAWSSQLNLLQARVAAAGASTANEALAFGGSTATYNGSYANTEAYQYDIEFLPGDRLAFKAFLTQVGALAPNASYTATINYNGATAGASGDTYFTLSPTFKFKKHITNFS